MLAFGLLAHIAWAHEKPVEGNEEGGIEAQPQAHCEGGAAQSFPCRNVDLLAWLPTGVFGMGLANDVWGWTDLRSGREMALLGLRGGTALVDVSEPQEPVVRGLLPAQTFSSLWRDIKTYAGHAFVVSEARGHGMQILDLRGLAEGGGPSGVFAPTAHYAGFGSAHNLVIDEETGMAFAVGTDTCGGGLHMVDVTRPTEPVFAGCFSEDGYTHDAQCVVYRGPDLDHLGREICMASNEDTLTIVDVTSRDAPRLLSRMPYPGRGYTHQGWLTEDQRYFLLDDELDERQGLHDVRTYVWDLGDLDAPVLVGHHDGGLRTIDHNLFVVGDHVFQANYEAGLRVLRMGDLSRTELAEVASFDTFPDADGARFRGAWGVYPFFESGVVLVSDINRGLFVLAPDLAAVSVCEDGLDNDGDGLTDSASDPGCERSGGSAEAPRHDVAIDVDPWRPGAVLNPSARGVVAVAVLSRDGFDPRRIDPATLRFGPGEASAWRGASLRSVHGREALVARYALGEAALAWDTERACLRWETFDGVAYEGCDGIRSVPGRVEAPAQSGPPPSTPAAATGPRPLR